MLKHTVVEMILSMSPNCMHQHSDLCNLVHSFLCVSSPLLLKILLSVDAGPQKSCSFAVSAIAILRRVFHPCLIDQKQMLVVLHGAELLKWAHGLGLSFCRRLRSSAQAWSIDQVLKTKPNTEFVN